MVAAELGRLHERERFLERELRSAQASPNLDTARLDDDTLMRLVGEETARVLSAARESATEIREKAEQAAARMLNEASDEAARRREEAEIEASRRRSDAANDAEAELSMAKQQGREMVNEARAYRERVLTELARRRELAREQIEQLIHGRDRLMQAFERARSVAVDVVSELEPIGEPDEYVNLQPTTGPVPVMVARADTVETPSVEAIAPDEALVASEPDDPPTDDPPIDLTPTDDTTAAELAEPVHSDADETEIVAGAAEMDAVETEMIAVAAETAESETAESETLEAEMSAVAAESAEWAPARDDVVVDLFARLRRAERGATPHDTVEADTALPADDPATPTEHLLGEPDVTDHGQFDAVSPGEIGDDDSSVDSVDDSLDPIEASAFEQRDADLTPLIVASARKLKRVLADEQNDVLDRLRRNDAVTSLDQILPSADEHGRRHASAISDDMLMAANAGAQIASPSRTARLTKADGRASVDQASAMVREWLVGPLRDRLERAIREGAADSTAITKMVRAVYREWKTQHIDEQLDDILRAAHGHGVLAATPPGTPVRWTPDPRHGSCPDCDDNALEGPVAAGQPFPTGDTFAPAHPGCRCMLLPTVP